MGGPDGERGLPHAPRAGDQTHHAGAWRTLGERQVADPGQLRGAAGEVVNQPGQLTHASRTRPVIPQPAIAGQLNKLLASIPGQGQRIRQRGDGPVLRPLAPSALHIGQSPGAHPRHLSQLLERQARRTAMTAQHLPETQVFSDGTHAPILRPGPASGASGIITVWQ